MDKVWRRRGMLRALGLAVLVSDRSGRPTASAVPQASLECGRDGQATLRLSGTWRLDQPVPGVTDLLTHLVAPGGPKALRFDCTDLIGWDSALVAYLATVIAQTPDRVKQGTLDLDQTGLPEGVQGLLRLAFTVPERAPAGHAEADESFLHEVGEEALDMVRSTGEIMTFLGEAVLSLRRLLRGRARLRAADLWLVIQQAGAEALPIVSLVSFLVGMIFGYIGVQQLAQFGARIYVASLVGLAMTIQMGALITAIVLSGRTGAAYAAQIGTMQVNEEIDALRTLGLSPMDFLVLPRMLALILMTPLLAVYADLMGIIGGASVGILVGGLTPTEYFNQTQATVGWSHIIQGLISATVYGAIVAVSGCLRGMQCGRSAAAVGQATTSAVVTSIVAIVIAAAVLTVIFNALGLQ
jgi:phospholipid/cholesterol/gamma-HCH transport system permease protein